MPILGVIASGISGHLTPADTGAMFALGSIIVPASGTTSITFNSIPATYKHLQVRITSRDARSATLNNFHMRLNGDSTNSYTYHTILADATTVVADGSASAVDKTDYYYEPSNSTPASIYASSVIDIADYSSSTKNKTIRFLGGYDDNGSGRLNLTSDVWLNTNAVTSLTFLNSATANFLQYSSFTLYGIK